MHAIAEKYSAGLENLCVTNRHREFSRVPETIEKRFLIDQREEINRGRVLWNLDRKTIIRSPSSAKDESE